MKRTLKTRMIRRKISRHEEAEATVFHMERYKAGRFWAVYDNASKLVCVCVYKKGAAEVVGRLSPDASAKGSKPRCQTR